MVELSNGLQKCDAVALWKPQIAVTALWPAASMAALKRSRTNAVSSATNTVRPASLVSAVIESSIGNPQHYR
jgi:uncharacterized protein YbdZ (MbtH family)